METLTDAKLQHSAFDSSLAAKVATDEKMMIPLIIRVLRALTVGFILFCLKVDEAKLHQLAGEVQP